MRATLQVPALAAALLVLATGCDRKPSIGICRFSDIPIRVGDTVWALPKGLVAKVAFNRPAGPENVACQRPQHLPVEATWFSIGPFPQKASDPTRGGGLLIVGRATGAHESLSAMISKMKLTDNQAELRGAVGAVFEDKHRYILQKASEMGGAGAKGFDITECEKAHFKNVDGKDLGLRCDRVVSLTPNTYLELRFLTSQIPPAQWPDLDQRVAAFISSTRTQ